MNTITMANALKAVFGAQTLTTASYFPACAQDGTPSGVISAANLASVLGVDKNVISEPSGSVSDYNELTESRSYRINNKSYSNAPTDGSNGLLIVFTYWLGSSTISQTFISANGIISQRVRYGGSWRAWKEYSYDMPTFYKNYADLSSLVSAIGDNLGQKKVFIHMDTNESVILDNVATLWIANTNTNNTGFFVSNSKIEITKVFGNLGSETCTVVSDGYGKVKVTNTSVSCTFTFIYTIW